MGYGLAGRRWACSSRIPSALVIDIAGEASVLMTMQEMSTAAQYRLPIKIFMLNNNTWAWCGNGRSFCTAAVIPKATWKRCRTS